jgi:hypothetical protein
MNQINYRNSYDIYQNERQEKQKEIRLRKQRKDLISFARVIIDRLFVW